MSALVAGAIAAPIIGGLIGNEQARSASADAARARAQAMAQFMGIEIPDLASQEISPEMLEYLGNFQAQQEGAIGMGPSAMEGVSTDPRLQEAQMAALSQISEMGETGLLPGEEAALRQARRGAASEAQAKSAQLMDEYARRGMGGSGAELAARLQASQSSADRQSQESDRLMQMAQERALSAIGQSANLAGQVRSQQFGEQSDVARAKDAISQFNTANQQAVQQRNVAGTNTANARNLSERQRIGEGNTAQNNQAEQYNKALIQKQYDNKLNKAAGMAGQYTNQANASDQQAGRTAQMWAGIGSGVGTGIGNYQQAQASDRRTAALDRQAAALEAQNGRAGNKYGIDDDILG